MLSVKITGKGLLDPTALAAWTKKRQDINRKVVADGMSNIAPEIKQAVRAAAASGLRVRRPGFLNIFRTRLWKSDPSKLPALQVYADDRRAPWIGIHETGGTITGRMIIPLLLGDQHITRKAFMRLLTSLREAGNLFFKKEGNRTLVFAKAGQGGGGAGFGGFRAATRTRTGRSRLSKGTEILIGVIVSSVTLPARLGFYKSAQAKTGAVVQAIEAAFRRENQNG